MDRAIENPLLAMISAKLCISNSYLLSPKMIAICEFTTYSFRFVFCGFLLPAFAGTGFAGMTGSLNLRLPRVALNII